MSWTVGQVSGTITVSEQAALELNAFADDYSGDEYAVYNESTKQWELNFIEDHMEHIDQWLYEDGVKEILLRDKANGEARFATVDQGCSLWEHRFVDGVHDVVSIELADVEL